MALPAEQARRRALTPRERETLGLLAAGLTQREAAARMGLSPPTLSNYVRSAWQRMGLRNRAEAVAAWREMEREMTGA